MFIAFITIACCMVLAGVYHRRLGKPAGFPLPPGPRGYPIIGNLFDAPTQHHWIKYFEWSKIYSKVPVISATNLTWLTRPCRFGCHSLPCFWNLGHCAQFSQSRSGSCFCTVFALLRPVSTVLIAMIIILTFCLALRPTSTMLNDL